MKVIEEEREKRFLPVSLVMECVGELDEVVETLGRNCRCTRIDRVYKELTEILSGYKI